MEEKYNKKYQTILDNYINGNFKASREALKKLSKYQLLEYIQYWSNQEMEGEGSIIRILKQELGF